MKKGLAGVLAVVGGLLFCVSVMITSAARKAANMAPPTCGAPVETSICLYFVEKYGDGFWRTIIIAGSVLIVLSIVLFVLPIQKKKIGSLKKENYYKNE